MFAKLVIVDNIMLSAAIHGHSEAISPLVVLRHLPTGREVQQATIQLTEHVVGFSADEAVQFLGELDTF